MISEVKYKILLKLFKIMITRSPKLTTDSCSLDESKNDFLKRPLLAIYKAVDKENNDQISEEIIRKESPFLGLMFILLTYVSFAVADCTIKIIFIRNPELNIFQLLLYRSVLETAFLTILINRNLKLILWDTIPRKYVPILVIRIIQGSISSITLFYSI